MLKDLNVQIEHIFHSGFTLETDEYFFIFDYYKGNICIQDKEIIVFVSHGHEDHYTDEIFKWKEEFKDIKYVLSSDIDISHLHIDKENLYVMDPYEELSLGNVTIKSFASTDLGLSFLVQLKDLNIFHAGDLNWWHWENDPLDDQLKMEKDFKDEINRLINFKIDVAFLPVDPRLNAAFSLAGDYFIKAINPKYFIPMHFGDNFYISSYFIHSMGETDTQIINLTRENQIIEL